MAHPLLDVDCIDLAPGAYLEKAGRVFALFDEKTQDSGNVSFGVEAGGERFFVKTAGDPGASGGTLPHPERAALLRNAAELWLSCPHPALARLEKVISSPHGPMLVYEWVEGELIYAGGTAPRLASGAAAARFRALPAEELEAALDVVYDAHDRLARAGWVALDFYDGCIIYDFAARRLRLVDLDMYRRGPFVNDMGRLFGSSRFMAPEEFERGAAIDERTNVYTMGRTAALFLADGTLERAAFRGSPPLYPVVRRACNRDRARRFASVSEFAAAWRKARAL